VENDEFSEILTYKRAKNSLFECKWGGVCRKFESFVENLEGFAPPPPPPPEKVNFRHWKFFSLKPGISFSVGLGACGCLLSIFKIFVSLKWYFPHFGSNFEQM
jgi:hypothetical protein